jgi:hypothetical protein
MGVADLKFLHVRAETEKQKWLHFVQVISKSSGNYKVVKTVGTSKDPKEIERFCKKAQYFVHNTDPKRPPVPL